MGLLLLPIVTHINQPNTFGAMTLISVELAIYLSLLSGLMVWLQHDVLGREELLNPSQNNHSVILLVAFCSAYFSSKISVQHLWGSCSPQHTGPLSCFIYKLFYKTQQMIKRLAYQGLENLGLDSSTDISWLSNSGQLSLNLKPWCPHQ